MGARLLLESKKEQVEEPTQPTHQEFTVKAPQDAGFSKQNWYWLILQDKTAVLYLRKMGCTAMQRLYQTEIYRNIQATESYPWKIPNWSPLDAFVSEASRSHVHRNSSTNKITGSRHCMGTRMPRSYTIGTSNKRIRTRD